MYENLAKELINHYGVIIVKIFNESLDTWHQTIKNDEVEHKGRTRSNYIWDTFFHKLQAELYNDPNFHFVEKSQSIFVIYRQTFLIRMKKLGNNHRPSSIKTQTTEKFQNQQDLGFGDLVNVYLFYSMDRFNISIDNISLQCENGKSILWRFPLDGFVDNVNQDLFSANQEIPTGRIRVKKSHKQEQQDEQAI
jgi:hypothetical protein